MKMLMTSSKLQKRNQVLPSSHYWFAHWEFKGMRDSGSLRDGCWAQVFWYFSSSCPVVLKSQQRKWNYPGADPHCLALMVICNNHYALPCMYMLPNCPKMHDKMRKNSKQHSRHFSKMRSVFLFLCHPWISKKIRSSDLIVKSVSSVEGGISGPKSRWLLS